MPWFIRNVYLAIQITKIYFSYTGICSLSPQFLTHNSPSPWNFLSVENYKGVFCCLNELTFGSTEGWGLVARRATHVIRGLELSFLLSSQLLGRGEELEGESIANNRWFNQSCLYNEASINAQEDGFEELPGWSFGESGAPGERWKLHALSHYLALFISSIWLFLSDIFL